MTNPLHDLGWRLGRAWRDLSGGLAQHWRAYRVLMAFGFQADRRQWGVLFVACALMHLGELAAIYALKLLTDGVLERRLDGVLVAAVVAATGGAVTLLCGLTYVRLVIRTEEQAGQLIDRRLMAMTGGIPGLEHHELPAFADEVALLRSKRGLLGGITNATVLNLRTWVSLVGSAVLLARIHPLLLLLPLFGLGSFFSGRKANQILHQTEEANAERGRLRRHLFTLGTSAAPAKELRVFHLLDEITTRHRRVASEMMRATRHGAWRRMGLELAGSLCFAAGYLGSIALVLVQAVAGQATPGDVVLVVSLAAQLNGTVAMVVDMGNYLGRAIKAAGRYVWLADYAEQARPAPLDPVVVPSTLREGIQLDRVSFRYPGTEQPVLCDVSLRLPAGAVVALVGENGAGKSTLVKLLCRLYEPQEGRILADGVDLRRFEVAAWRARIRAGFQDFVHFELRAGDAVGVGDLERRGELPAVERALARAGATEVVATLPAGLQTQLGTAWEGGVELSGGQWQRLALARAVMRERPLLTVFDEPTAALDAQTEYALFERFAGAARSGQLRGAITLLVSHRFSTVRLADLIVVLEHGRILEQGSHAALLARQGLYAELYTLQARAYR
ncbi:MAG TPA: ABC transporter ATP-binding protein [Chloroflexota bacterium]|nr:ABC transporter ATP-binding protein [Chloroflexota bacterium]